MPDSREVPERIRDLATQLAQAKPMRRGSLSERYVKCSKPGCPTFPTSSGGFLGSLRAMGQCPTRRSGGFRGRPKKGLQTALEAEVAQEVEALLGREALAELDFEALEVALRQRTLRLAAHAIEQRLNADLSDEVSALRCPCGNRARYVARRTKNVVSVL